MSTPNPSTIILTPATPADIPTLANISSQAFKSDSHTRLKELIKGSDHAAEMSPVLESWISRPERCVVLKAVITRIGGRKEEGQIVGWVAWGFRGVTPPTFEATSFEVGDGEKALKERRTSVPVQDHGNRSPSHDQDLPTPKPSKLTATREQKAKIAELEDITNSFMAYFQSQIMPPSTPSSPSSTRCLFIIAITVHPSYQGLGIGRELVRWGTKIADKEGVFCWVSSSDGAFRMFEKEGFEEVERLEKELDGYACGVMDVGGEGSGKDGKWGKYVWRYMVRPARSRETV